MCITTSALDINQTEQESRHTGDESNDIKDTKVCASKSKL